MPLGALLNNKKKNEEYIKNDKEYLHPTYLFISAFKNIGYRHWTFILPYLNHPPSTAAEKILKNGETESFEVISQYKK